MLSQLNQFLNWFDKFHTEQMAPNRSIKRDTIELHNIKRIYYYESKEFIALKIPNGKF